MPRTKEIGSPRGERRRRRGARWPARRFGCAGGAAASAGAREGGSLSAEAVRLAMRFIYPLYRWVVSGGREATCGRALARALPKRALGWPHAARADGATLGWLPHGAIWARRYRDVWAGGLAADVVETCASVIVGAGRGWSRPQRPAPNAHQQTDTASAVERQEGQWRPAGRESAVRAAGKCSWQVQLVARLPAAGRPRAQS